MHVFPATANDCILQTNSFGLVNRHIFRPTDKNGTAWVYDVLLNMEMLWNMFAYSDMELFQGKFGVFKHVLK